MNAAPSIFSPISWQNLSPFAQRRNASFKAALMKRVALQTLVEIAVTAAFAALTACFVTTPAALLAVVVAATVQCAVNFTFRCLAAYALWKGKPHSLFQVVSDELEPILFTALSGYNVQTVVHEAGHAWAAKAVYAKSHPRITVIPFVGGATTIKQIGLTPLGKKVGVLVARFLFVAAGPVFTLLISSIAFVAGQILKHTSPRLAKHLITYAVADMLCTAYYAYTAIGESSLNLSHDFVSLSHMGLSPVTATISILALPIILYMITSCCQRSPHRHIYPVISA